MRKLLLFISLFCSSIICISQISTATKSVIVNFGSDNCGNYSNPSFSLIGSPTTTPYLISTCFVKPPIPNIWSKFIAYNPRDNKIYINDIAINDSSRLYVYNPGIPASFGCPSTMPTSATYIYDYVPNNFEFDANGDVYTIRSLSGNTALLERMDEATGTILATKSLVFPATEAPNTLGSGDVVITPNGRMYFTLGDAPSRFYEVTNYTSTVGVATATLIQQMPRPCYGILYCNGKIELNGTNFGGYCYKYLYDLGDRTMSVDQTFQLNQLPIDNTSITVATGVSKRLVGNVNINANTEDITYEMYARNMGNTQLANFNITENLATTFGAANISNVTTQVVTGKNPAGLLLNPLFDGVTNTKILADNQTIPNISKNYIAVRITVRATNLITGTTYLNTAFSSGEIGAGAQKVAVIDSSNDGDNTAIDLNFDGDAGEVVENKPTPYFFGPILPINFTSMQASFVTENLNHLKWAVSASQLQIEKFEIEYKTSNNNWVTGGFVSDSLQKEMFYFNHIVQYKDGISYRVKAITTSGKIFYSKEVYIKSQQSDAIVKLSPNPADGIVMIYCSDKDFTMSRSVSLYDALGKKILEQPFTKQFIEINTANLLAGNYVIIIKDKEEEKASQLLIEHN
jgi:Secretion system C-terminal sorting domain